VLFCFGFLDGCMGIVDAVDSKSTGEEAAISPHGRIELAAHQSFY
jgi:hypothetical protein